jgi:hypothetical protein
VTLVDTNILLDLTGAEAPRAEAAQLALERHGAAGPRAINDVVFAELSIGHGRIEACEAFVEALALRQEALPRAALFLAGKAFLADRRRGVTKRGVLPDFLIGAQALETGWPLLTRDDGRYRLDFPTLALLAP